MHIIFHYTCSPEHLHELINKLLLFGMNKTKRSEQGSGRESNMRSRVLIMVNSSNLNISVPLPSLRINNLAKEEQVSARR